MDGKYYPRTVRGRGDTLSTLSTAVEIMNLAKEDPSVTRAKPAFESVGALLTTIGVCSLPFCDYEFMFSGYPGVSSG